MKVEDYDGWIIRVGKVFLVGMPYEDTQMCRLSESPYEAVRFQDGVIACRIARLAGGDAVKFNPVTGVVQ